MFDYERKYTIDDEVVIVSLDHKLTEFLVDYIELGAKGIIVGYDLGHTNYYTVLIGGAMFWFPESSLCLAEKIEKIELYKDSNEPIIILLSVVAIIFFVICSIVYGVSNKVEPKKVYKSVRSK